MKRTELFAWLLLIVYFKYLPVKLLQPRMKILQPFSFFLHWIVGNPGFRCYSPLPSYRYSLFWQWNHQILGINLQKRLGTLWILKTNKKHENDYWIAMASILHLLKLKLGHFFRQRALGISLPRQKIAGLFISQPGKDYYRSRQYHESKELHKN